MPVRLREKIQPTADRLLIDLDDGAISLTLFKDNSNETLQTMHLEKDDALGLISLQEWLKELTEKNTEIILVLPMDKVLVKSLTLPLTARDNVREILGFEMDRQTPFSADQVYFDHLRQDTPSNKDKVQLDLFVVTKKVINDLLIALQDWQIQPQRITIRQNDTLYAKINLLPEQHQSPAIKKTSRLTQAMAVCCFLLFISAMYLPLSRQEQKLAKLETVVNKQRIQAKQLLLLATEKDEILVRSRFLLEKRSARIPAIEILDELSLILPDDTWLNRLVVRGGKIEIQGESNTATAIIQLVENSNYFRDAQFRSPVTRNNVSNKDKFNVSAKMEKRGGT